ncbi:YggT family protein [Alcaligenaceae bacterium 429]|uniref:YggT family protein n=1 Tax=Paenalcaligenes sp. Me52 TaxID=3392038 RepID=UPI001091DA72|nr:YggT family protein [Alcaligenaceae bacterium 429]
MFTDILYFIANIALSLLGIAFVLRAWLYAIRLHPFNPYSQAIFKVTDWAVLPLHRFIPNQQYVDWPSLAAAYIVAYVHVALTLLLLTDAGLFVPGDFWLRALLSAVFTVAGWIANMVLWVTLIQALLSWINPMAPVMPILNTLTAPLLNPIRRLLPRTGAFDFSPLALLVLAQICIFILGRLKLGVFAGAF